MVKNLPHLEELRLFSQSMGWSTLLQIPCFTDQQKVLHERIILKMANMLASNRSINRLKLILSEYEFKYAWSISCSENVKPYSEVVSEEEEEEKFAVSHL